MKIKKEFIPLILKGEKKYEFRKLKDKMCSYNGYYLMEEELYKLSFYDAFITKAFSSMILEIERQLCQLIDRKSRK